MSHCRKPTSGRGVAVGVSGQCAALRTPVQDHGSLFVLQRLDRRIELDDLRRHASFFDDDRDAFESRVAFLVELLRIVVADERERRAMPRWRVVTTLTFQRQN